MTDETALNVAREIMALVDEFPSEPFSYERKQVESKLELVLARYADDTKDAHDSYYQVGFDEGHYEAKMEAEDEYETRIQELEEAIDDLRNDLNDAEAKLDQAFAEGYETASKGFTHGAVDNFDFS